MRASGVLRLMLLGSLLLAAPAAQASDLRDKVARLRALVTPVGPVSDLGFASTGACPRPRPGGGADPQRLARAVRDAAIRFRLDRELIRAVIRAESAGDPGAVSHAGAMGLMQLMPATARELGVVCPFDVRENVTAGARYLRHLRDRFGGWRLALSAYNAGPERVRRGRIPAETRRYVQRVLAFWRGS